MLRRDPNLLEEKIGSIVERIRKRLCPSRIILFGSRAKGTASRGSDIDIAIAGVSRPTIREERKLKEELDIIAGLYSVDLLFLDDLHDDDMIEIIRNTGVVLHEKE